LEAQAREILAIAAEERRKEWRQKEDARLAEIEGDRAEAREQREAVRSDMRSKLGEAQTVLDHLAELLAEADQLNRDDYALAQKISDGQSSRQISDFRERLGFVLRFALSAFGLDKPHPGLPWKRFSDLVP